MWEILIQESLQLLKFLKDSLKFQAHKVVHLIDFYACFSTFMLVLTFLNLHYKYAIIEKEKIRYILFWKHKNSIYYIVIKVQIPFMVFNTDAFMTKQIIYYKTMIKNLLFVGKKQVWQSNNLKY